MGIHLREKKLGNGQVSLYLDIYHNKHRWYEFLDIHISKSKLSAEDKEKTVSSTNQNQARKRIDS
ncbi:MAG: hypothetical protein IPG07_10830 [Crocinitomicaceae bacterium]|nr:hypothetical protein [Crocinitomicaceae bacterium]